MYCGGEPININTWQTNACAKKYIHMVILNCTHRVNARVMNLQAQQLGCLRITDARYYKFHTMLTGAECFNNNSSASEIIFISNR